MTDKKNSGMAIASMVLGICSVLFFWVPFFGIILGVLGVVFGFIALSKIKREKLGGRGMAIAGIVTGFAGILIFIIFIIAWSVFIVPVMKASINSLNITTQNITYYP